MFQGKLSTSNIKPFTFFLFFSFTSLTPDGPHHSILPVVTKDHTISPRFTPYNFSSRCKFSKLTSRQPMVEFYLLTFPRFPLQKKEHKSYFGKNRTHDFRTSRCAGYLLDHSGDVAAVSSYKCRSAATTGRPRIVPRKVHQYRLGLVDVVLKRLTFLWAF